MVNQFKHRLKNQPKDQKIAVILALAGMLLPGLHKFYLHQPRWGITYLLLSWTPIPRIASLIEALWYLLQAQPEFDRRFNSGIAIPETASGASTNVTPDLSPSFPLQSFFQGTNQTKNQTKNQTIDPAQVPSVVEAVRQIEQLRQEGLISEYEFEQKRRQLLDRIG